MNTVPFLNLSRLPDALDIGVMALLIYSVLVWLKRTQRAAAIMGGIIIVAVVYLAAKQFGLQLTTAVLQGFFAVFLIALVVIFQEELRYFFEQIAHWGLNRPLGKSAPRSVGSSTADILTATLTDLARQHIGALVVVQGRDLLVRHLAGGQRLGGEISTPLLASLFDPHSAGHDGAVVIHGANVEQFGCRLPLSKETERLRQHGTRHAAALGLSELTDALCLVVSEERGTISVARHGALRPLADAPELRAALTAFGEEINPAPKERPVAAFIRQNSREKVVALGIAAALWFVFVYESPVIERTFTVAVTAPVLPPELRVRDLQPRQVEVTLSGLRKDFFRSTPRDLRVRLRADQWTAGQLALPITAAEVAWPENLNLVSIAPPQVTLQLERVVPATSESPAGR